MHSFNDSPCLSLSYLVTIYIYIYWLNSFFVLLFLSCPFFPDPVPFLSLAFICFFHLVVFVLLCSALLSSSTCFSIRCLSPSFFFVQLCLLALLSSSPRIRCWSLSTCSYSPTQTLPTFSHRSFLWVFLSGGAGMDAFLFPLSISVPHTRLRLFREPLHPPMYMSMNMSLNMSLLLFPMPLSPCY